MPDAMWPLPIYHPNKNALPPGPPTLEPEIPCFSWYLNDGVMGCSTSGLAIQQPLQQLLQEGHLHQQLCSRQLPHPRLLCTMLLLLQPQVPLLGKTSSASIANEGPDPSQTLMLLQ